MHRTHGHGDTRFEERPAAVELSKGRRQAVLAVVCLALALVMGMAVSLSVALPDLARDIGATQAQLQWIVNAYAVVFAGLLLPAGAFGDRHGRRGVLLAGLLIFGVASAGAVVVESPGALIALRTVSGVGAAMIMPMTLSIVTSVFPPEERGGAVGVWAGVAGAGTFVSLLVSGALLEFFSWPSIFVLSVVLAALALIGTAAMVPTSRDAEHATIDSSGAVLSVAGISGVVFAIIEGPALGWASPAVVAAFVVGVLALVAFVRWERCPRFESGSRHFLKSCKPRICESGAHNMRGDIPHRYHTRGPKTARRGSSGPLFACPERRGRRRPG
jgi:MFS family permease